MIIYKNNNLSWVLIVLGILFTLLHFAPIAIALLVSVSGLGLGLVSILAALLGKPSGFGNIILQGLIIIGISFLIGGFIIKLFGIVNDGCSACEGTGYSSDGGICDACSGTGKFMDKV